MIRLASVFGIVVTLFFVVQSCSKKRSNCLFIAPQMVFVGFPESESDTLVIRRYAKNNAFDNLIDTFLVSKANVIKTSVGEDSVVITPSNYTKLNHELHAFDWEINLPGSGRTLRITEVKSVFQQQEEAGSTCHSYASSLRFDETVYNFTTWFDTHYRVYVTK